MADTAATASAADIKLPPRAELTDSAQIRHTMDEAVIETVVSNLGYPRDFFVEDVKLALGAITVGIAIIAHLLPGKLANHWWLLFMCVAGYALLSTAHSIFTYLYEKDFFLHTKPHPNGKPGIQIESRMPKYSPKYSLVVNCPANGGSYKSEEVEIGKFFHEDGYLAVPAFQNWVKKVLSDFQSSLSKKKK